MDENKVIEAIVRHCETKADRRYLTCTEAFKIAQELDVEISMVGQLCNMEKIKLQHCQLCCF